MPNVAIPFDTIQEMSWFKSVIDEHAEIFYSRKTAKKNGRHIVTVSVKEEHLGEFLYFIDNDTTADKVIINKKEYRLDSDAFKALIESPAARSPEPGYDINLHILSGKEK